MDWIAVLCVYCVTPPHPHPSSSSFSLPIGRNGAYTKSEWILSKALRLVTVGIFFCGRLCIHASGSKCGQCSKRSWELKAILFKCARIGPSSDYLCMHMEWICVWRPCRVFRFQITSDISFPKGKRNCYFVWIARTEKAASHASYSRPKNRNSRFYYILIYLIFCYKVHKNVPRPRPLCRSNRNGREKYEWHGPWNDGSVGMKYYRKAIQIGSARECRIIFIEGEPDAPYCSNTSMFDSRHIENQQQREWGGAVNGWILISVEIEAICLAEGKSAYNRTICVYFLVFIWHKTNLMDDDGWSITGSCVPHTFTALTATMMCTVSCLLIYVICFYPHLRCVSTWPSISQLLWPWPMRLCANHYSLRIMFRWSWIHETPHTNRQHDNVEGPSVGRLAKILNNLTKTQSTTLSAASSWRWWQNDTLCILWQLHLWEVF